MTSERLFLCVELDDDTRHAVATHLKEALDGRLLPGRSVPPANWHITLRFLGKSTTLQRDLVLNYLDEYLAIRPFRVRFGELGGFPRESKASVLWMGVDGDTDPLDIAAAVCEEAAVDAGFEPEGRPFHPHLTLARIRPPVDVRQLIDMVAPARISMDVTSLAMYRSVLGSGPARYEVVDRIEL